MTENFPPSHRQTDTKVQILEAQETPGINVQETTIEAIIILNCR